MLERLLCFHVYDWGRTDRCLPQVSFRPCTTFISILRRRNGYPGINWFPSMFTLTRGNSATSWVSESHTPAPQVSFREKMERMPWSPWHSGCHPDGWSGEAEQREPRGWYVGVLRRAAGSETLRVSAPLGAFPREAGPDGGGAGRVLLYLCSRFHRLPSARVAGREWEGTKGEPARQRFAKRCHLFAKNKLCATGICVVSQI